MVDKERGGSESDSLSGEGEPGEMARYLEILAREPASVVFAALAEVYRKRKLLTRAIEVCKKGLRTHPNFLSGRVALARAYMDAGQTELAQRELEKVAHVAPDNLVAQRLLVEIYRGKGQLDLLEKTLYRILSLDMGDQSSREGLLWVEERRRAQAEAVPPVSPPRKEIVTKTLAEIYASQGHYEKAFSIYRELARRQPASAALHERLADLKELILQRGRSRGREEPKGTPLHGRLQGDWPAEDRKEGGDA